jgi:AcrR family transcriptional regulator
VEEKKLDRRERRTRQALSEALIALMQEKRYDAITVQDIIDRADVGRSTFYAHYRDKEDLFVSEFQAALGSLLEQIGDGEAGEQIIPSLRLFRHFREHHHLYQALVWGRGLDTLSRASRGYLTQIVERRIARLAGSAELAVPLPVLSEYLTGTLLNLIQWWLDNHMPYSPERMDEIFQRLVMPGVRAAFAASELTVSPRETR